MNRFDKDDDERDDESFNFTPMDDDEIEEHHIEAFISPSNIAIAEQTLDQALLIEASRIAESSFFYKFKSPQSKLKIISEIYQGLYKVLDGEI